VRAVRTAVVTGGSSGIGLAVARRLARRGGWRLVLAARDPDKLGGACAELDARAVAGDLADPADAARLAEAALADGGCDLLVQCAGISGHVGVLEASLEAHRRTLRTNYLGLVAVSHALWPQLVERRGRMANVVSVAGTVALPSSNPYGVSKAAALAYSRALAARGREDGVLVTTVNPGPVPTPGFPQRSLQKHRVTRLITTDADECAARILDAADRGVPELFIPRWFRAFAALQALVPVTMARGASVWGGGAAELDHAPAAS
jgi:short-subunit dehydrogenase